MDTFEVENLADWGEVVGARVSMHGLQAHTMTHAGCGRYDIKQGDGVEFHHDGPFEFTLFSSGVNETSVKERNPQVSVHMTECTKEFTYDGVKVPQRVFDREGDRHFVFGSCEHHCPGFYEDVLTHYGTSCPVDEKADDAVINATAVAHIKQCNPGSFTNANDECEECPIGTYTDAKGLTTCKRCQPGQFNPFPDAEGCMACPDGYFQPNWGQQYCVACDGDAALGKKGFALQGASLSRRKMLGGGWWNWTKHDADAANSASQTNYDQYHKIGATSLEQCGNAVRQETAEEYGNKQEHETDPNFDATPGSSNEPVNDGPNGPAATPILTGRTDKFGHCVCPSLHPKPVADAASTSSNSSTTSASSTPPATAAEPPVASVVAGQPCGPCPTLNAPAATNHTNLSSTTSSSSSTPTASHPPQHSASTTSTSTKTSTPTVSHPPQHPAPTTSTSTTTSTPAASHPPQHPAPTTSTSTTTSTPAASHPPQHPAPTTTAVQHPAPQQQQQQQNDAHTNNNTDGLIPGETIIETETLTETGSTVKVEMEYTADGELVKTTTVTNPSGEVATTTMHVHNASLPISTCDEVEKGVFGTGYRGCQDKTRDGQQCIDWKDQYVATGDKAYTHLNYPEGIEENPGTQCRNPAGDKSGIWCFTGTDGSWQVCSPLMQAEADATK